MLEIREISPNDLMNKRAVPTITFHTQKYIRVFIQLLGKTSSTSLRILSQICNVLFEMVSKKKENPPFPRPWLFPPNRNLFSAKKCLCSHVLWEVEEKWRPHYQSLWMSSAWSKFAAGSGGNLPNPGWRRGSVFPHINHHCQTTTPKWLSWLSACFFTH